MKLYIVRHGETDWNAKELIQGDTEVPLNEKGRVQANVVKEKLKEIPFDICYTSPLSRAKDTAEIIVGNTCPVFIANELIERDYGNMEGTSFSNLDRAIYWDYLKNTNEKGVEPVRNLLSRTRNFLESIVEKHKDKTVLIVTHGSTLRALHYGLMGYTEKEEFVKLGVKNCQIFQYEI